MSGVYFDTKQGSATALLGLLPHTPQQANQFLARTGRRFPSVQSWNWISPEGKIMASSRPARWASWWPTGLISSRSAAGRRTRISDILDDRTTGRKMFVVCSRVSDAQGRFRGAVSAVVGAVDFAPALLPQHGPNDVLTLLRSPRRAGLQQQPGGQTQP